MLANPAWASRCARGAATPGRHTRHRAADRLRGVRLPAQPLRSQRSRVPSPRSRPRSRTDRHRGSPPAPGSGVKHHPDEGRQPGGRSAARSSVPPGRSGRSSCRGSQEATAASRRSGSSAQGDPPRAPDPPARRAGSARAARPREVAFPSSFRTPSSRRSSAIASRPVASTVRSAPSAWSGEVRTTCRAAPAWMSMTLTPVPRRHGARGPSGAAPA